MTTLEKIKEFNEKIKIEDVISEYIDLTYREVNGISTYVGKCHCSKDNTNSLVVFPSKGIYKCFSCGESGSHIGFIQRMDSILKTESYNEFVAKMNLEFLNENDYNFERKKELLTSIAEDGKFFKKLKENLNNQVISK